MTKNKGKQVQVKVMGSAELSAMIVSMENSANRLNLVYYNDRFNGSDSNIYNKRYQELKQALKKAQDSEYKNRSPARKIADFQNAKSILVDALALKINPSVVSKLMSFQYQESSQSAQSAQSEYDFALKSLKKVSYCIEITTIGLNQTQCKHSQEGYVKNCDCQQGKQNPTKKLVSEKILADPLFRPILLVIVNGVVIDINNQQSDSEVRQAIRDKIPIVKKKSSREQVEDLNRFADFIGEPIKSKSVDQKATTREFPDAISTSFRFVNQKATNQTFSDVEVDIEAEPEPKPLDESDELFTNKFARESSIIQEICESNIDVAVELGMNFWPKEFDLSIRYELANQLKKGFLPMNLHACIEFGRSFDHLLKRIKEYKIAHLKSKFPEFFPRHEICNV